MYHIIWDSEQNPKYILLEVNGNKRSLPTKFNPSNILFRKNCDQLLSGKEVCVSTHIKNESVESNLQWILLEDLTELVDDHGAYLCQAIAYMWKGMPLFENSLNETISLPSFFYKKNHVREVTFFGGSFNPWHLGHRECLDQCQNNNIIIVPDTNPWKDITIKNECAWKSFRSIALVVIDTDCSVYPGYWGIKYSNPTSEWIANTHFEKINLLIGDDNFMNFDRWKNPEVLNKNISEVMVVPRNQSIDVLDSKICDLEKIYPDIEFKLLKEHKYQEISSTTIRGGSSQMSSNDN